MVMKINKFEKFYKKNFDKIYKFVFFRAGCNKELTEDLVSEIFTKALVNFTKYDEKISASAWIYTIAKNHLANYYRDNQKKALSLEEIEFDIPVAEEISDKLTKEQAETELCQALKSLPQDKRQLIILKYIEGFSYQEISEITGKSKPAVKVATHRAMRELKNEMTND